MAKRKDDGDSPHKRLEQRQGERLARSWRKNRDTKLRGDKYARYIHGDPPPLKNDTGGRGDGDKGLTEAQREMRALGKGWIVTTYPYHGQVRDAIIPSLVSKEGTWVEMEDDVPPGADEMVKADVDLSNGRNRIFRELAKLIDEASVIKQQLRACVDDTLQYGNGWLFIDFSNERKLARIRWVSAQRVMYDTEPDIDPFGDLQQWRAVAGAMPLSTAQHMLKNVWGEGKDAWAKKGHEFQPVEYIDNEDGEAEETPTDFVRLVHVYVRGNNPYTDAADLDVEPGAETEKTGDDPVYKGRDECLVFEATGRMDGEDSYVLIARYPSPYPFDFPMIPLMLTDDNESFCKPPFYQRSHSLCLALNGAIRNYNTKMFALARTIVGYDPSKFTKATFTKTFFGPDALNLVEFNGGDMMRAFAAIPMGEVPKELQTGIAGNKALADEVSGLDVYELEQRSHQPATNAALQDSQKQLRLDEKADRVEAVYERAMNMALGLCMKVMTAEEVAAKIGDQWMGWYDDNGVRKSRYWNDEITDNRAIREMARIKIEPRSVRFVSPEQELTDLQMFMGKITEYAAQVQQANETNPQVASALAKVFNVALEEMAGKLRLSKRKSLRFDLNAIVTQPIQQQQVPEQSVSQTVGADGSQTIEASGPAGDPMAEPMEFLGNLRDRGLSVDPSAAQIANMMGGGNAPQQ